MLRQYSKTLLLIGVAAILFLGDFAVELLAPDLAKLIEQEPRLKLLLWGLLFCCLAAAVFLFVREHNAPAHDAEAAAGSVFATEADRANRRALLGLVRRTWVEGVLHRSLWHEVRLVLNLEARPDAVVRPCDLALRRAGQPEIYIKPGTSVLEVYRQEQVGLLLLGEPGSGKTTLLLEIAQTLLQEAEEDETLPIPIVFNLSAWRRGHTRLDVWLVEQLNRDYGIPEKIGRLWVEGGALLLLLDGLDEVAEERRAECLEAINAYRLKYQRVLRPMVVCCRTREYDEIPELRLSGAVVIQPLTRQQVDGYLKEGGRSLAGLRAVLKDEPALYRELFATPLMLHVAVMTYEGQPAAELRRRVTPEERRMHLWDAYIERMFERKQEAVPLYDKAESLRWLAWLGDYLSRKDLQKYLIEWMQPNDLPRPWEAFTVRWLLLILLSGGYSLYLTNHIHKLLVVLCLSAISYSRDIQLQPIRRFTIRNLRRQLKPVLIRVAATSLFSAAASAVIGALGGAAIGERKMVVLGVTLGAAIGAATGILMAAVDLMVELSVIEDTVRPNEGIYHSLRISVIGAAVVGTVTGTLSLALISPNSALLVALSGALCGALVFGGRTVFQHYLLRLLLWRSGLFPRDIKAFLDWAAQRVLVQRVGGGWRFIHRTLQERFAERYIEQHLFGQQASPLAESLPEPALSRDEP